MHCPRVKVVKSQYYVMLHDVTSRLSWESPGWRFLPPVPPPAVAPVGLHRRRNRGCEAISTSSITRVEFEGQSCISPWLRAWGRFHPSYGSGFTPQEKSYQVLSFMGNAWTTISCQEILIILSWKWRGLNSAVLAHLPVSISSFWQ